MSAEGRWPAAGWYPIPDDETQQRFWDGREWTDAVQSAASQSIDGQEVEAATIADSIETSASAEADHTRPQNVGRPRNTRKIVVIALVLTVLAAVGIVAVFRLQASREYDQIKASPPPGLTAGNWSNYLYLQKDAGVGPRSAASAFVTVIMKLQIDGSSDCGSIGAPDDVNYQWLARELVGRSKPAGEYGPGTTFDAKSAHAYVYATVAFCEQGGIDVGDPAWLQWLGGT